MATPTVVGQVRSLLEFRLVDWGLTSRDCADVGSALIVVAAELVTNAVDETPDQLIKVCCRADFALHLIKLGVWDSSDRQPTVAVPEFDLARLDLSPDHFDDNGGWGLPLVEALSHRCGITPTHPGKWVWAHIAISPMARMEAYR